jgi:hypothetical protein
VDRSDLATHRSSSGERTFEPRVEFRYTVGGKPYQTMAQSDRINNYASARRHVERHPAGGLGRVHYNPANPSELRLDAALTPEFFVFPLVFGLLGVVFFPLGLALLYQGFFFQAVFCAGCRRLLSKSIRFCPYCGHPVPLIPYSPPRA